MLILLFILLGSVQNKKQNSLVRKDNAQCISYEMILRSCYERYKKIHITEIDNFAVAFINIPCYSFHNFQ